MQKTNRPLTFSIALPVLGQEEFLPTALRSLRAQEAPFRLSVLDATPGLRVQAVLEEFQDMIAYRRHGADRGQSAAIQEGWDKTDGEILAWLCADDYYFPDALQRVREAFAGDVSLDVVWGDSIFVDAQDRFLMYFPGGTDDLRVLACHDCIPQPSCFIRRRAVERVGGLNQALHYTMDWDLWSRVYETGGKFLYLKRPLSVTRIHGGMKTLNRSRQRYAEITAHLKRRVGWIQRVKTLLAFYHYDLDNYRKGVIDHVLYHVLDVMIRTSQIVSPRPAFWDEPIYGLERLTNRLRSSCEVLLPWYQAQPPRRMVIQGDRPIPLVVDVNGSNKQTLNPVAKHGQCEYAFAFTGPLASAYRITISLPQTARDWRLRKLWLE